MGESKRRKAVLGDMAQLILTEADEYPDHWLQLLGELEQLKSRCPHEKVSKIQVDGTGLRVRCDVCKFFISNP